MAATGGRKKQLGLNLNKYSQMGFKAMMLNMFKV